MVLEGLRWSLHGMSGEWEMRFEKSAADALQAMASARFDAIITDMRMPAMDGAELLEVVKRRYPGMVRFVLSGQANKDAVLRSVAPAHQFLSKPCDPVELKSRLTQAFAMRDLLSNDLLQGTVSRLRNLPSLPALYGELTAELQSEDCPVLRVEKIVARDVGMAAKILQLANSAFIGAQGHVTNLSRAISLIGTQNVRTLVLSVHLFSRFDGNPEIGANLQVVWEHNITWPAWRGASLSPNMPRRILKKNASRPDSSTTLAKLCCSLKCPSTTCRCWVERKTLPLCFPAKSVAGVARPRKWELTF